MAALSSTVRFELGVAFFPGRLGVALLRLVLRLFSGDDELLVRASAVLKSQGRENWSRGRPDPLWARINSLSVRDTGHAGKSMKKKLVGWRHVAPQVRGACGIILCL